MEIRKLEKYCPKQLRSVMEGFESEHVLKAEKSEGRLETTFRLTKTRLEEKYVKKYELTKESAIYSQIIPTGYSFGVFEGSETIGISINEKLDWNNTLWVWEFHVKKGFQGQGIGKMMMENIKLICNFEHIRAAVCEVQNTNMPAIEFYWKNGFEIDGIDLSYYDGLENKDEIALFMKWKPI